MPRVTFKKLLRYLPWEFDTLGGVDVVVDRLWNRLVKRFPGMVTTGVQDWVNHGASTNERGRRFPAPQLPGPLLPGNSRCATVLTLARRLPDVLMMDSVNAER